MERYGQPLKNPSFSSALLDAIYRSTDDDELILYKATTMRKNQCSREDELSRDCSLRRACRVEKWMEKKVSEKVMLRRKASELERFDHEDGFRKFHRDHKHQHHSQSSSSSSESSDNGTNCGFSSSEAESVHAARSSAFTSNRPKPVRTTVPTRSEKSMKQPPPAIHNQLPVKSSLKERNPSQKIKDDDNDFSKENSKSRAARFYNEFKKAKQPISPGSKFASFLNSLFTAGNAKKVKLSSHTPTNEVNSFESSERKSNQVSYSCDSSERKSNQVSSCSSASSYSRSCLSKTPSSTGGKPPSNGVRRSVRFYPMSIIVGEDSRPCGQKFVYLPEETKSLTASKVPLLSEKLKLHLLEKNKVEETAKGLFKEYQKKSDFFTRDHREDNREEDDDDDDAASYSSSDLFELENLAAIGIGRYQEELPVYETTNLATNQAIAKGLIL